MMMIITTTTTIITVVIIVIIITIINGGDVTVGGDDCDTNGDDGTKVMIEWQFAGENCNGGYARLTCIGIEFVKGTGKRYRILQ